MTATSKPTKPAPRAPRFLTTELVAGRLRIIRVADGQPISATPRVTPGIEAPNGAPTPARLDVDALLRRVAITKQRQAHTGTLEDEEAPTGTLEDEEAPSGEELRWRREAAGVSQADLAEAARVARSSVAAVELGDRNGVSIRRRIGAALDRMGAPVKPSRPDARGVASDHEHE